MQQLCSQTDNLIPALLKLVGGEKSLTTPALTAMINMSQEPSVQEKLLSMRMVSRCMDYLKEKTCPGNEHLLIMLLVNLTTAEEGSRQLLQIDKGGDVQGLNLAFLLGYFLAPRTKGEDTYEHVASILSNATVFKQGRKVVLEPGRGTLEALASQLEAKSPLRRQGCAGAIKNCCFACDEDGTSEAIAEEGNALHTILTVLCEGKAEGKAKENLAEAVYCLAKSDVTRKKMWQLHAVELLRKGYEFEEHPVVCEALEGAAEFFLQDGFDPSPIDECTQDES